MSAGELYRDHGDACRLRIYEWPGGGWVDLLRDHNDIWQLEFEFTRFDPGDDRSFSLRLEPTFSENSPAGSGSDHRAGVFFNILHQRRQLGQSLRKSDYVLEAAHGPAAHQLRGFLRDAGVGRKTVHALDLVSVLRPPPLWDVAGGGAEPALAEEPFFVPDQVWATRYDEAALRVSDWERMDPTSRERLYGTRARSFGPPEGVHSSSLPDYLGVVPFFDVHVVPPILTGKRSHALSREEFWSVRWILPGVSNSLHYYENAPTLEEAVDQFLRTRLVLPQSEKEAWDAAHVEYGTWVCPAADEVELFRMLDEPLPLFWASDQLYEWVSERRAAAGAP